MLHVVMFGLGLCLDAPPALANAQQAVEPVIRDVASRDLVLSLALGNAAKIDRIRVWCTRDGGVSWSEVEPNERFATSVGVRAAGEGEFGYFLVAENAAGASSAAPTESTPPHVRVRVDLTPPVLQLHEARVRTVAGLHRTLRLRASVVEEHLGPQGLRLFVRGETGAWVDAGSGAWRDGWVSVEVPPTCVSVSGVRLVASDLAGNAAMETLDRVQIEDVEPNSTHAVESVTPAGESTGRAASGDTTTPDVAQAIEPVPHVAPVPAAPDPAMRREEPADAAGSEEPSAENRRQTEQLRALARQHLDVGEYALAAARFEEALRSAPDDADLLVSLGSALYRTGRYDEAAERYEAAVKRRADHTAAIEGLALVDATRRRYPQAREHLKRLLTLSPESAEAWMHLGDVEHRLGETPAALDAWNRALGIKDAPSSVTEGVQRRMKLLGPPREAAGVKDKGK